MLLRAGKAALSRVWTETRAGFASIRGSPPDLYKVLVLKVRCVVTSSTFKYWVKHKLYLGQQK